MIEIDGSQGEGGGQIIRTAVALSAVTGSPIRITKIRSGRPNSGLSPQHVKAIEALAQVTNARTKGVKQKSSEIVFQPGQIRGGTYDIKIGTAGSITLLMQCLLPALIYADAPTLLKVRGGTDVKWSPTIDYFHQVALPAFSSFGVHSSLSCINRGYYPRGGGAAILEVVPGKLKPAKIKLQPKKDPDIINGISHCSNLPEQVAQRQAEAAARILEATGRKASIEIDVLKETSTGSGITLWSGYKGASALGEPRLKAEKVGTNAAKNLLMELNSEAAVDVQLADQLIPYLALSGGSYTTRKISKHTITNIWTAAQFLDSEISVNEDEFITISADI